MKEIIVRFSWGYVPGQSRALKDLYPKLLREIERLELWPGPWINSGTKTQMVDLSLEDSDPRYSNFLKPVTHPDGTVITWSVSLWSKRPDGKSRISVAVSESDKLQSGINLVLPYEKKECLPPLDSLERLVHGFYPSAQLSLVEF